MTRPEASHTASDLLVLHAVRCCGYSGLARIASATGQSESDVESTLIDLAVNGLVVRELGSWGLTVAGRAADAERIADELDSADARDAVRATYERFMVLNPELLDLCTAWQLRPVDGEPTINDHRDHAYDTRVLQRFTDLHERAGQVFTELTSVVPRFGRYRLRLAEALEHARRGELEYVADNLTSYHAVWAELHEDLLSTLGIPR